jgi:hypothetical protein
LLSRSWRSPLPVHPIKGQRDAVQQVEQWDRSLE